jgi:hypothetical protein
MPAALRPCCRPQQLCPFGPALPEVSGARRRLAVMIPLLSPVPAGTRAGTWRRPGRERGSSRGGRSQVHTGVHRQPTAHSLTGPQHGAARHADRDRRSPEL